MELNFFIKNEKATYDLYFLMNINSNSWLIEKKLLKIKNGENEAKSKRNSKLL